MVSVSSPAASLTAVRLEMVGMGAKTGFVAAKLGDTARMRLQMTAFMKRAVLSQCVILV